MPTTTQLYHSLPRQKLLVGGEGNLKMKAQINVAWLLGVKGKRNEEKGRE